MQEKEKEKEVVKIEVVELESEMVKGVSTIQAITNYLSGKDCTSDLFLKYLKSFFKRYYYYARAKAMNRFIYVSEDENLAYIQFKKLYENYCDFKKIFDRKGER
jgi:hypothetical protein